MQAQRKSILKVLHNPYMPDDRFCLLAPDIVDSSTINILNV